jgi:regulation of enolase protein 1 (concanavalin A-like superfamily)
MSDIAMSFPPLSSSTLLATLTAAGALWASAASAQDTPKAPDEKVAEAKSEKPPEKPGLRKMKIENWGVALDLAGDCEFKAEDGKLSITVPGSAKPHDMSTELLSSTAPRVLQPASGDFVMVVKVEGEFAPGGESTQRGRTGYTGAGLVVFADAENYVRLERATLQSSGEEESPYTNFEIRVDGDLERIGNTGDIPTEAGKPTWLRLERKGNLLLGSMSQDGVNWKEGVPKELRSKAWKKEVLAGVAAISTSKSVFKPNYSHFSLQSAWVAPKTDEEKPEIEKPGK